MGYDIMCMERMNQFHASQPRMYNLLTFFKVYKHMFFTLKNRNITRALRDFRYCYIKVVIHTLNFDFSPQTMVKYYLVLVKGLIDTLAYVSLNSICH